MNKMHELYKLFGEADDAWSAELKKVFGKHAGDARYDNRGVSTDKLKALYAEFKHTGDAWRHAISDGRS